MAEPSGWIRQAGLLTAIPFVLLIGPLIGYFLGVEADQRWNVSPWGIGLGVGFGILASLRVVIDLIKQARELERHDK